MLVEILQGTFRWERERSIGVFSKKEKFKIEGENF